jgi:hypothetical protein
VERGVSVDEIEAQELNGQKLQGTTTAKEVNSFLKARGCEDEYPLFKAVAGELLLLAKDYEAHPEQTFWVDGIPWMTSQPCWHELTMFDRTVTAHANKLRYH